MYESSLRNSTSSSQPITKTSTLNSTDENFDSIEKIKINSESIENNAEANDMNQIISNKQERMNITEKDDNEINKSSNLSSLTNSLNKSKFKARLAIWNEANMLNEIPSPKIKMVYSGHRNTRTMVQILYYLIISLVFNLINVNKID